MYGIGDLNALIGTLVRARGAGRDVTNARVAGETHKFESRYCVGLLGSDPEVVEKRSPLCHLEGFSAPILLLQGTSAPVRRGEG